MKRSQEKPGCRPEHGTVHADEVLPLAVLKQRLGWGNKTAAYAQRDGLRTIRYGQQKFVLGRDLIQFFRTVAARKDQPSEQPGETKPLPQSRTAPNIPRLQQQIQFLVEVDKLKQVLRRTWLMDQSRYENDAEHSWHIAVAAMLFLEYADDPKVDVLRVNKMLLVHDLVEIDAGDTYAYDEKACLDQAEREQKATERVFGLLPSDQAAEFRGLWEEFEARQTPDARYAAALDRFQPLLHNYMTGGRAWLDHAVTSDRVFVRNGPVVDGAPLLGQYAEDLIRDAVAKGYLAE